jgi:hypothetical protein
MYKLLYLLNGMLYCYNCCSVAKPMQYHLASDFNIGPSDFCSQQDEASISPYVGRNSKKSSLNLQNYVSFAQKVYNIWNLFFQSCVDFFFQLAACLAYSCKKKVHDVSLGFRRWYPVCLPYFLNSDTVIYVCCDSLPAKGNAGPDEEAGGRKYGETWKEEEGGKGKEEEEEA